MQKYRKKPVVIEALQYDPSRKGMYEELEAIDGVDVQIDRGYEAAVITTLEGKLTAEPGDYIIRGVQGEVYPCKPDIFEQTYDLAE